MILKPRISGDISYKRRWEYFAAIIGIGLGYPLLLILMATGFSTDIIYEGLTWGIPELLGNIEPLLAAVPYLLKGVFASINDLSLDDPYYPITFFFISFVEFPCNLSWILPAIFIGYYRNKQYMNIEVKNNGWKVFWHGAFFIEIVMIIFTGGFLLAFLLTLFPGATAYEPLLSYFGSGTLRLLLIFISPFFWLGLLFAGLGGFIGKKLAINKASQSEVVIEEVEPEKAFEEEILDKEMGIGVIEEAEEVLWPEEAAATGEGEDLMDIKEVDITSLKSKIKAAVSSEEKSGTPDTIKCSNCNHILPYGAKFCNNCGTKVKYGEE